MNANRYQRVSNRESQLPSVIRSSQSNPLPR